MADEVEEIEEEDVSGPVARRKKGSGHSGWCLSSMDQDSHQRCPITVGDTFTCNCTCSGHGSRKGEDPLWMSDDFEVPLDARDF